MTAEIFLSREQEDKFFTIYREQGETCTNQELVQRLFNEALNRKYRQLMSVRNGVFYADEYDEDYPTDEEIAEIMTEIAREQDNDTDRN